jgi:uncharacterized membrane protein (DUF106 family)
MGTTTPFGPDFYKDLIAQMFKAVDDGTKMLYQLLWDELISFLVQHWLLTVTFLLAILIYAFIRALAGRWGMLGSVLYNYFYFGTLFTIGLIWGPKVFADDYFKIALVILYVICFLLVGQILRKTGVKG